MPLIVKGVRAVRFGDKVYPTAKEGLYRFLVLFSKTINLISLARDEPLKGERGFQGLSLIPLVTALANLQVHGWPTGLELPRETDELGKRAERWSGLLRTASCSSLLCGEAASMVRDVVTAEGYRVGLVDANPGSPPDSHVMVNIYWPARKRWVLVDPDLGLMLQDARGEFLHAHEVGELLATDDPALFPFSLKRFAVDPRWRDGDFSWAAWYEVQYKDHASMLDWYRVVFQGLKTFNYRVPGE